MAGIAVAGIGAAVAPAATAAGKIRETLPDGSTRIVHRMGDLGWFDDAGRLWFCGRKSQRVVVDAQTTLCTEQVEPVFNVHPKVRRTALVGVGEPGHQVPVLCVELAAGVPRGEGAAVVDELFAAVSLTARILTGHRDVERAVKAQNCAPMTGLF